MKLIVVLGVLAVFLGSSAFVMTMKSRDGGNSTKQDQPTLTIQDKTITVEVARTPEELSRGLSYRDSLPEDHGMLFIFEEPTRPSFWMFEMKFPLDMIWIKDNTVVHIHENVPNPAPGTPPSELPTYQPPVEVDMVLEVNAGWAGKNEVKIGDIVSVN